MTDEPRKHVDLENLIVGHFEGTLAEEQEANLADALATSAEAKQLFVSYMRMEGRLHSLGRDGFLREPLAEPAIEPKRAATVPTDAAPLALSGRPRLPLFAATTSLAVCAAVVLMLLSGVLWPSSVSASSVLQKAQQAAAELIDRTYRVTISQTREHSESREFTINVRGGGRFVMQPADSEYVMGNDGTDYWLIQRDGPVWVTSDFRSVALEVKKKIPNRGLLGLAASPDEPLLLGVSDLLSMIQRKFDVELIESGTVKEHHIRATVNSSRRNHPEVIDLWSEVASGVVLRAEVKWSNGSQRRFELVESVKLSEQWYHHWAHAPGRKVERIHAASQP